VEVDASAHESGQGVGRPRSSGRPARFLCSIAQRYAG
jgi:hypothetical protein